MTEVTRTIVRTMYAAYARRDFDRVAAFLHDDIDWIIYGPMQIFPFVGKREGKRAVLEALGAITKDYVLERYTPEVMIVDQDRAAVMSDVSSASAAPRGCCVSGLPTSSGSRAAR